MIEALCNSDNPKINQTAKRNFKVFPLKIFQIKKREQEQGPFSLQFAPMHSQIQRPLPDNVVRCEAQTLTTRGQYIHSHCVCFCSFKYPCISGLKRKKKIPSCIAFYVSISSQWKTVVQCTFLFTCCPRIFSFLIRERPTLLCLLAHPSC